MTALIAHLSDLHLMQWDEQEPILDALIAALESERRRRGSIDVIVITGDVFDSARVDPQEAARRFTELHARLVDAAGNDCATVIVPGNHDRRHLGFFAPHREELFEALSAALGDRAWVHGCASPFLADVVPPEFHRLPLWLVVYDSSFVPRGMVSAGGMMRQEDLLYAASRIGDRHPDWPVLFLLHHHLVPTPLTDTHPVEVRIDNALLRWGLERALPWLVAHADREELTMTALGAGTAISTLHTLGRAVLVLHGHKHYATARMLDATWKGHGDVLIVSAGSAGTAHEWTPSGAADAARLWPSFNLVELDERGVRIDTISFGYKGKRAGKSERRPMVRARKQGAQWLQDPIDPRELETSEPRLALNRAHFRVEPSIDPARWDYVCERRVELAPGASLSGYSETVAACEGASLVVLDGAREPRGSYTLPRELHLALGGETRFRVQGGVHRRLNGLHHQDAVRHAPFASVRLMNRYPSQHAELIIEGLGEAPTVFASATDLGTGLERPLPIEAYEGGVALRYGACPPRTLLRIYWPLQRP
ncbi:MAG TPA: metallophosphoesterase [Polyangiaceae bacterium]|nr:metallophosphoesterase [Polyangiaceae bacterium]